MPATMGASTWADAFYHHGTIDGTGRAPRALTALERWSRTTGARCRNNHAGSPSCGRAADPDLLLVNAHDHGMLAGPGPESGGSYRC
jgi:hypothetical protein